MLTAPPAGESPENARTGRMPTRVSDGVTSLISTKSQSTCTSTGRLRQSRAPAVAATNKTVAQAALVRPRRKSSSTAVLLSLRTR